MTSFTMLSPLLRATFAFWALILCLTGIISIDLAMGKHRYLFAGLGLFLFAPAFFAWQVIFDFSLIGRMGNVALVAQTLCDLAWVWWFVAFAVMTIAAVLLLGYNIRYERTFITPNSIKDYLDKIPCGVCCWRDNGRVQFSNICMNSLCEKLTGGALLNGNHYYEAITEDIQEVDGRLWRFACRETQEMVIAFSEDETGFRCHFTNDGKVVQGNVAFTGGLANLARLAEEQGASVSVNAGEKFTLTLFFPEKNS